MAGRRPVEEAFVARRPAHRLLVVPQRRQALERLVLHATSLRIPVVEVEGGTLTALAGFDGHQGIALAVEPRVYAGIDDVLARAVERGEPPFILVLDSLEDPQNVGTLLRSAEAAGVHGVIFPTHRQAPLTPAAIKASAGAVEHLLLAPVDDLPGAMSDLRVRGLQIAAAEADAPLTAAQADLRGPLAIVVGSEGQGLSPAMRRRSDIAVRIPMRGAIGSLNAAVAGSILLFAAVAQRDPAGLGDKPARPVGADAWPVRNEPGQPRGQSVVLPTSTEGTPAPATEPTEEAPRRRRTASKAPSESEPQAADAARPTRRARAEAAAATAEAESSTAKTATPKTKTASRTARKAPGTAKAAAAKVASAATPGRKTATTATKPPRAAATRATVKATGAAAPKGPKLTKAPATTRSRTAKSAAATNEPAVDASTNDDELLPGGPDPA